MEAEILYRILLPALLIVFVLHRGYYVRKHGVKDDSLKKREIPRASCLAGKLGLAGLAASIVYVARPDWISWAAMSLPVWGRWAGIGTALLGFGLLQWAQNTLGANWVIRAAWTGMTLLEALSRNAYEESLMREFFGDQYRAYMTRTGRLLPRISSGPAAGQRTA